MLSFLYKDRATNNILLGRALWVVSLFAPVVMDFPSVPSAHLQPVTRVCEMSGWVYTHKQARKRSANNGSTQVLGNWPDPHWQQALVSFKNWWQGYHRPRQGRIGAEGVLDRISKVRGPGFRKDPVPASVALGRSLNRRFIFKCMQTGMNHLSLSSIHETLWF